MKSPFKFLDSYEKQDKNIFFGREKETEELYHKVFESKLLLIYGVSGTGKTSIINCGLANKFEDSDWLPVSVRRGRNIVDSLLSELTKVSISSNKSIVGSRQSAKGGGSSKDIVKLLKSAYLDHFKPIYLIFDQFEEIFIEGSKEERTELIKTLKAITDSELQCRVIISMREEYIAGLAEFEEQIPGILDNRFRVEKMTRKNALEVITGPCRVNNINTEEGFAGELLEKLSPESADIELTYLQVYLDRIYKIALEQSEKENTGITFRTDMLETAGEVSDLLGDFLEEQINKLAKSDEALIILKSFVTIEGTKKHISLEEIIESAKMLGHSISSETVTGYLNRFVNLRILRDADESGRFELRHDSLAARIFERISLREKELIEVREFIETAFRTYKTRDTLMPQSDLEYIDHFREILILPKNLDDFIDKSKNILNKNKKALKRVTTISVIAFIAILLVVVRYSMYNKADKNFDEKVVAVMLQVQKAPVSGLLGAFEIYKGTNNNMVGPLNIAIIDGFCQLLKDSANAENYRQIFDFQTVDSEILSIVFANDGSVFCGHTENKEVYIWDAGGKELFSEKLENGILDLKFSIDSKLLAVITENDTAEIIGYKANTKYKIPVKGNDMINSRLLCFFADGSNNIAAVNGKDIHIYNSTGKLLHTLSGHKGRVNSIDISPDSHFISSASCDSKVYIWNFNNNTGIYSIYDSIINHQDTVWSCEFNNTGKYILTASADSSIQLANLLGERLLFGASYRDHIWNYYTVTSMQEKLDKPRCNATFTGNNESMIITIYKQNGNEDLLNDDKKKTSQMKFMYNDYSSSYYHFKSNLLTQGEGIAEMLDANNYYLFYNQIISTGDESFLAIRPEEKDPVSVVNADGLLLFSKDASDFAFTPDNNYFISSLGGNIEKIPINRNEISSLLFDKNIFDLSESDFKKWFIY